MLGCESYPHGTDRYDVRLWDTLSWRLVKDLLGHHGYFNDLCFIKMKQAPLNVIFTAPLKMLVHM